MKMRSKVSRANKQATGNDVSSRENKDTQTTGGGRRPFLLPSSSPRIFGNTPPPLFNTNTGGNRVERYGPRDNLLPSGTKEERGRKKRRKAKNPLIDVPREGHVVVSLWQQRKMVETVLHPCSLCFVLR